MRGRTFLCLALLLVALIFPSSAQEMNIVTVLRRMFPEAEIQFDPLRNTLIVTATPDEHRRIEEMIEQLDIYTPQITIEAKFIELIVTDIGELGIDLDILNLRVGPTLDEGDVDFITDWADMDTRFPHAAAATGLWFTRLSDTAFQAVLQALEKQERVNILSAPRVTTLNGQPATIHITTAVPYVTEVDVTHVPEPRPPGVPEMLIEYTVEERDAGIYLEVTPTVPEGSTLITLHIKPTVRHLVERVVAFAIAPVEMGWPVIDERTTETSMVISSGETVALGGLIRQEEKVVEKKFPLLGDIPLFGHLFRHKYSEVKNKNLIILLTAYLVSPCGEKIVARR